MSNTFTMKANYGTVQLPTHPAWYEVQYDAPAPIGLDNHGNAVYADPPGPKGPDFSQLTQGTTATGYNRNSMQSFSAINYNTYNMRWYNTASVSNVTVFNKYIFEKIRKMNKDLDKEMSEYFGDSVFPDSMKAYVNMFQQYFSEVDSHPKGSYFSPPTGQLHYMDFMYEDSDAAWKHNACALHLIGTPEDVEELSMFPGLIVREVSDETHLFIKDAMSTSILHTQNQLIKYKLDTYYSVIPNWWTSRRRLADPIVGLYDHPYSECQDFQDPRMLETIDPSYEQHINPDERVYKIYIQMSDDLVATAYDRSNFFIGIRNTKKKMSIKNFMKYLS